MVVAVARFVTPLKTATSAYNVCFCLGVLCVNKQTKLWNINGVTYFDNTEIIKGFDEYINLISHNYYSEDENHTHRYKSIKKNLRSEPLSCIVNFSLLM